MIPEDTPSRGPLKTYVFRSAEYLHNAYVSLDQEELEKASELLWGSMALAVKAVAALREIELRSHAAIWEYASITTTLPKCGQLLAGNRFAEGKSTKLSSAWAGRHEEVLKAHFAN